MTARIQTPHPEKGKSGVNIDRHEYVVVRDAILDAIRVKGEITFKDLSAEVKQRLEDHFEGSVSWYVTTIKLDPEARGAIEPIPGHRPQHLRVSIGTS